MSSQVAPDSDDGLLERAAETALLADRLNRAYAGRGAVVLVEGPAGTGKTALLQRLRRESAARGMRLVQAVAGELEREFPFGVVRQLLEPVVLSAAPQERERLLSGAAGLAASIVGGVPGSQEASADASFAALHGLYWLVAGLAEEAPLVLVVDDAHWADAPSLRFLDFLGRRVPESSLLVVVASRPREPGSEQGLLDRLAEGPDADVVRLAGLSAEAVGTVVRDSFTVEADDALVAEITATTGGNPLLLRELVRTLAARDAPPSPAVVREAVPSSVTRSVSRRLERLDHDARRVARAAAVLGEGRPAELLAGVLDLEIGEVRSALERLRGVDLLVDDPAHFVHPLLRQAVADHVAAPERARLHQRAAELLRERPGAEDEVVAHLLAGPPASAPWAFDVLLAAGRRALAEGAPEVALRRLSRALDELAPGDLARTAQLHLELGRAAAGAGDPSAGEHLAVAADAGDPVLAARATELQMNLGAFDPAAGLAGMTARLRAAVERLGPEADAALRDRLLGQLLNVLMVDSTLARERASVLAELATAGRTDGPGVLSHRAWDAAAGEHPVDEALAVARASLADRPFAQLATVEQPTPIWAVLCLLVLGDPQTAGGAIADAEQTLRAAPSILGRSFATYMRAEWLLVYGSVPHAEASAREALDLFDRSGNAQSLVSARAVLASALVLRGELAEAEETLAELPGDDVFEVAWGGGLAWTSRAELRLAQGRPADAVADLRRLERLCERYGWRRFPRGADRALLARALVLTGEADEGRALAEAEVAVAVRRGIPRLEAEAHLALATALPGDERIDQLRLALAAADRTGSRVLQASAALQLGAALRRAGQRIAAREHLSAAREHAHAVDAGALLSRATDELTIAGGRPRRIALTGVEALTPSERRVAEHAASGLSNREIAEALFVTRKTVEFQLGSVYTKLGIRSRTQLGDALGNPA